MRAGRPTWSLRMRPAAGGGRAPMGWSGGGGGGQCRRAPGAIGVRSARHTRGQLDKLILKSGPLLSHEMYIY